MKKLIALLFFAQFISLSQTAQVKKASDACPGSNKNNNTSKDYAYLSKRTAGDSDFSKPKYQSIYAKNTSTNNTPVKRGRASASEEKTVSAKAEKPTIVAPEAKNKSSKTTREPVINEDQEFPEVKKGQEIENVPEVKETENIPEVKETENIPEVKEEKEETTPEPIVIAKAEQKGTTESVQPKGKTAAATKKEKQAEEAKKSKQKQQRQNSLKKLRFGKKNATDCPDF